MIIDDLNGTLRRWMIKGSWSILDQALYAGTHLIISVILARNLDQKSFGIYAFIFSIYIFFQMAYRAFWYGPMLFYGVKKYDNEIKPYFNFLSGCHWLLFLAIFLVLIVLSFFETTYFSYQNIELIWAVVAAFSSMLFLLFNRRSCYMVMKPKLACIGSFVYLVVVFLALLILVFKDQLFLENAFWALTFGSLLTSILVRSFILKNEVDHKNFNAHQVVRDHWTYGKWLLLAAIVTWLSSEVFYSFLLTYGYDNDSGALKALMTLVKPIYHVNLGLSALLIPAFVKSNSSGSKIKSLKMSLIMMGSIALLYMMVVIIFGDVILQIIYGDDSPYIHYVKWLYALSLLPVFHTLITIFGGWLQAINKTRNFAIANAASAMTALIIGYWLIPGKGLSGAVIGLLFSSFISSLVLIIYTLTSSISKQK